VAKLKLIFKGLLAILCFILGLNAVSPMAVMQKPESTPNQPPQIDTAQFLKSDTSQFTQSDTVNTEWQNYQDIPASFELMAENDVFQLFVNKTTLAFKVVDKRSGYVWHSNLDETEKGDKLNKTWKAFAQSGISIDYLDQKAASKRASITNTNLIMDVKPVDQGFEASVKFTDPSISLVVIVRLDSNGVSVEVPFESIKEEDPNFKLGMLHVYPFFGATREDSVPGYMFIPDGSGSLIRFSAVTKAKGMFYGKYYGPDLGMITSLPYDRTINRPYKISIPVTGMVHGYKQNAYISIVEKGASYAEIQAHPSGVITNFNFIYNAFIYNESYFQATNRSGAGVTVLQRNTNAYDIKINYRFLTKDDSDYVGMAKSYQQYLLENGKLKKAANQNGNIGIRLEFLGAEKQEVLLWWQEISMTTVSQMNEILKDLNIKTADVIYYGWQPLGASSMPPESLVLDSNLGNLDQLLSLMDKISADGGNFYLYLDPQSAIRNESGYSPRNDLAMSITNENLVGYSRNKVNYYRNFDALKNQYSTLSKDVFSKSKAGLALDGISSMIYSDFKKDHFLNREDAIQLYQQLLAENDGRTSFYLPNDYMFGYMDAYYDIPLTNSGYIYTTDVVPFLQIVFAGYVPYYGPALNFSSNLRNDLLRQIDFGVYPSYMLSNDVTAKILNTDSNWIYTSSYNQWAQEIKQTYQWLNNLLQPVKGQEIVARQVLEDGVVATTYANGKQIIVNYNDKPFSVDGLVVNSQDAVIREVLP
jgi:hypothetical protein